MVKTGIKIFARLRPTKKSTGIYDVGQREDGLDTLTFTIPRSEGSGAVNNKREIYPFRFTRVFSCQASQEEVFNEVSRGIIDNCLEGYNGTIFAYGQTGSGKTFTITGGVERYSDRGLIPRSLSYLYQQYEKSPGTIFSTQISYLEIYNECGYDLLDPQHEAARLEDLPKVTLLEDRESMIHLRNLSLHPANNEEEALNWLFLGDTNRMMAETPMNMTSTRSHCIFTIHITSRQPGSDTFRHAKLHLVDLAGSERVGRTGIEGTLLTESKYINLSLHFLEQVIVALSEKSRSHIPYRNSMMTSVLRDSLGGNCMTSMIATCSVEKKNIEETISTCRFSQRVALVKNEATLNEELDPKLVVQHLRQQVAELKDELSLATGEEREGELDETERSRCEQLVTAFLEDPSPEARLLVGGDMRKIQLCFSLLKAAVQAPVPSCAAPPPQTSSSTPAIEGETTTAVAAEDEVKRLEEIIRQRDEEISILLKMLKQGQQVETSMKRPHHGSRVGEGEKEKEEEEEEEEKVGTSAKQEHTDHERDTLRKAWKAELSRARQEAFDSFRKDCPLMARVSQHKTQLKTKYAEAKALGDRVHSSRTTINELKSQLGKYRISRGLGLTGGVASGPDEKELEIKSRIESEKAKFKSLYQTLHGMKTEIEHTQHLLERSKVEVQHQFEEWWQRQVCKSTPANRTAWKTPPTSTPSPQSHRHSQVPVDSSGQDTSTSSRHHQSSSGHHYSTDSSNSNHTSGHHHSTPPSSGQDSDISGPKKAVPLAHRALPQPLFLSPSHPAIPLTGDEKTDADILAFYRASQKLAAQGPQ